MEKDYVVGPVAYALVGAGACISIGMLYFSQKDSEWGRVDLDHSIPLAACGVIAGSLVGQLVAAAYQKFARGRAALRTLTTALLWVAIGMPLGWLAGGARATNAVTHERLTRLGMLYGAVGGATTGLLSGFWVESRRRRQPASD
jgi:hypothetical protein